MKTLNFASLCRHSGCLVPVGGKPTRGNEFSHFREVNSKDGQFRFGNTLLSRTILVDGKWPEIQILRISHGSRRLSLSSNSFNSTVASSTELISINRYRAALASQVTNCCSAKALESRRCVRIGNDPLVTKA